MQRSLPRVVVIAAAVYALDRLTKYWVLDALDNGSTVRVLGDLVQLRLFHNPGAAFSMGTSATWLFTSISAAISTWIIWRTSRGVHPAWAVALGALLGGSLGNLTDRLTRPPGFGIGHVVDFISVPHFAVFNVADSAIVCSTIFMVLLSLRDIPMSGRPVTHG